MVSSKPNSSPGIPTRGRTGFSHWCLIGKLGVLILGLVTIVAALLLVRPWGEDNSKRRGITSIPYGLEYALRRHEERGGAYIWGRNDCSIFVLDYLKACDVKVSKRLTTKELAQPQRMRDLGMKRVQGGFRPGDVLVYRWNFPIAGGHCGVLQIRNGRWEVIHNAKSSGGIRTNSLDEFLASAGTRGVQRAEVSAFRPVEWD